MYLRENTFSITLLYTSNLPDCPTWNLLLRKPMGLAYFDDWNVFQLNSVLTIVTPGVLLFLPGRRLTTFTMPLGAVINLFSLHFLSTTGACSVFISLWFSFTSLAASSGRSIRVLQTTSRGSIRRPGTSINFFSAMALNLILLTVRSLICAKLSVSNPFLPVSERSGAMLYECKYAFVFSSPPSGWLRSYSLQLCYLK